MAPLRDIMRPVLRPVLGSLIDRFGVGSPVQLVINYTSTEFTFKFKAPSTSTVKINWGDGTSEEVVGEDDVLIIKTSSYPMAGTYNFSVTGDVYDLTKIDVNGQAFISGDYTYWYEFAGLTELDVSSTGMSGNIEGFAALTSMTVLNVDNTTATGNGALLAGLTSLTSFLFNSTAVTWGSAATMSLTSATVNAASSGMNTTTQVDNFIDSFKASTGSAFDVSGTNAHRTAASNDDLNTLLANGNTITLNDILGAEKVTDGAFPDATNWDVTDPSWSIAAGVASYDDLNNGQSLKQTDANMVSGMENSTVYRIMFTFANISTFARLWILSHNNTKQYIPNTSYYSNGIQTYYFTTPSDTEAAGGGLSFYAANSGSAFDVDDVSIKEVTLS